MGNYRMPSLNSPIVDELGRITPVWAALLRDYMTGLSAEMAPGRIAFFDNVSAANLADATKFVQSGTTAGLGLGDYLGWAICNGNNGTVNRDGYFVHGSTVAAGAVVGSNSSAHTHDRGAHSHAAGTLAGNSHTLTTSEIPSHYHQLAENTGGGVLWGQSAAASKFGTSSAFRSDVTGGGGGHTHTVSGSTASDGTGNTGSASATDNRPLSMSAVPMMRV